MRAREMHVTDRCNDAFAEVSLDRNPVHVDAAYAAGTVFMGRTAHG